MSTNAPLVLGIDGGGTKTVAWLALLNPLPPGEGGLRSNPGEGSPVSHDVLGRGTAGPGNPRAAGFDVAQTNIDAAIDAAFAEAKLPRQPVAAACFGLAGCGRAEEQERMTAWAESRSIAYMIEVTGDAEPLLAAASPENWGIALICGTGSLAWGRNQRGQAARCGGWGYLMGDDGSAYAIALAGLRAAVRAADGRGAPTVLLSHFLVQFGVTDAEQLVGKVYVPEMSVDRIAALAATVFRSAPSDAVSQRIIAGAAKELAKMTAALVGRLQLAPRGFPLALAGSVLLNQPDFQRLVRSEIAMRGLKPSEVAVAEPVIGAVKLARQLATAR
ncbi:MAG TPA: BadF/BadG/BcrA/BcrD ATPase family protein [Pirellulaceae bacterium]|nr:BadF/BadG/BcrA/BcrD ATPase family protein [Pirellulaceae bacterium]